MKILFFTIALDAMPWITMHWPELKKLKCDWDWWIMEGVAGSEHCTKWCNQMNPRLSRDGTTQYLDSIAEFDRRIHVIRNEIWHGKVEMVNSPLSSIQDECLLWEIDCDEVWKSGQIEKMRQMFLDDGVKNCAYFWCNYFVGMNWVIRSRNSFGNHTSYEWHRVWKVDPGVRFLKHEPPVLDKFKENPFTHAETERAGLVFDHYAYASESTVRFKQEYYGRDSGLYCNAVSDWKRLQSHNDEKAKLKDFLPWVQDETIAERLVLT